MKKLLAALAVAMILTGDAWAADVRATPEDAQELVKTAVAYLKKHGKDRAFKEFQNRNGPFIYKDLYLFVYDLEGTCVAHGADPSRVGKNYLNVADEDGTLYTKEYVELAKTKGAGWTRFRFRNPATGKVEPKKAYTERVGDVLVGSGAYTTD
ncbi:cache domain-containing protein [Anaeromyxobacter dehalogenans]|uniref:Cache domain protein n=1 Tax=Anaeromyxobacter dehalogenans (strain 2CP-C) TaxID=290397 RepID=Q2IEB9_ANADE|nr:cache domain-containing protein [Anaeromyxobacter dehalogenans]ABC82930.1 Cache domain protein [Anaeromyxobacter dehalogenans 2CP-C]